jgi:hypothetical protein
MSSVRPRRDEFHLPDLHLTHRFQTRLGIPSPRITENSTKSRRKTQSVLEETLGMLGIRQSLPCDRQFNWITIIDHETRAINMRTLIDRLRSIISGKVTANQQAL